MGKKAGWLNAVKKAFSPSKDGDKEAKSTKDHQQKTALKEKKRWGFGKPLHHQGEALAAHPDLSIEVSTRSEKMTSVSEKSLSLVEKEQNSHALAVAAATAAAAEAAVAAAQAAAEVVRLTGGAAHPPSYYTIRSREEQAAVKIQAAFRGYLARRAFRALKGLMRLQALVRGHTVKRQATVTLRCMQSLVKVQAEVRERRLQKAEEQKHLDEGLLWQAQHRDSASKRSLLWKSGAITDPMLLSGEQGNGHWDWSWLEKWMAGRSWDGHGLSKEIPDVSSLQSHEESQPDSGYTNRSSQTWKPSTPGLRSPARSTKVAKPLAYTQPPSAYQYSRPAIAKSRPTHSQNFGLAEEKQGDFLKARSSALAAPAASKGSSKQSTTSSSVHDDEDARAVPSYMASTKSAKAKSRSQSTPSLRCQKRTLCHHLQRSGYRTHR